MYSRNPLLYYGINCAIECDIYMNLCCGITFGSKGWHRFGYAEGTHRKPVKKLAGKFTCTCRFPVPKSSTGECINLTHKKLINPQILAIKLPYKVNFTCIQVSNALVGTHVHHLS